MMPQYEPRTILIPVDIERKPFPDRPLQPSQAPSVRVACDLVEALGEIRGIDIGIEPEWLRRDSSTFSI